VAVSQEEHDGMLLYQMEEKKKVGKASAADLAAQRATLAQSKVSRTQAEANLNIAILDLTQLLELPTPDGFAVAVPEADDFSTDILLSPEVIYEQAVGIKPSVLSAELALDRADLAIASAKGAYMPSISLSAGLGSNFYTSSNMNYGKFLQQMRNNFSQYVGLSLNIPIFTRFSTRNNVRTAKLNKFNQQLQVESVKKALYKEIQQAYYNALNSQAKYNGSIEARESANEHYRLTEEKYLNGKAGIAEYNDAKNNFLRAESELLRSRYECLFQVRLLDFYRGGDIVM
jgi:outer membrane protein